MGHMPHLFDDQSKIPNAKQLEERGGEDGEKEEEERGAASERWKTQRPIDRATLQDYVAR